MPCANSLNVVRPCRFKIKHLKNPCPWRSSTSWTWAGKTLSAPAISVLPPSSYSGAAWYRIPNCLNIVSLEPVLSILDRCRDNPNTCRNLRYSVPVQADQIQKTRTCPKTRPGCEMNSGPKESCKGPPPSLKVNRLWWLRRPQPCCCPDRVSSGTCRSRPSEHRRRR